jgi:ABC-2 type transport system permease protein
MTTTALHSDAAHSTPRNTGVTFARVVHSEWIKLRTLRSTVWCFGLIVLLMIGFGLLLAATLSAHATGALGDDSQKQLAVQVATLGVNFTQLIAAVLGVLIISGEYSTGMIRSTFAAVPTRLPALFAKALVLAVTTFVVGLVSIVATAFVTMPILSGKGIEPHLLDSDVMLALLGGAGYLALIALLAFAIGAIVRSSAGGIAAALGLVLVVPPVLSLLSSLTRATWVQNVSAFLPSAAGQKMYETYETYAIAQSASGTAQTASGVITLDGIQGLLVLLAWIVVLLAAAAVLLERRDA